VEAASREEPGVAAMLALAQAAQDRSLAAYKAAVDTYRAHLITDPVIAHHLKELQEDMLEKNLSRYTFTPPASLPSTHVIWKQSLAIINLCFNFTSNILELWSHIVKCKWTT
jgi:hypothetical protein